RLVLDALNSHCDFREMYCASDPPFVTQEIKRSKAYRETARALKEACSDLSNRLNKSVPFFSYRYQGHMNWDLTLPGILGFMATMLYNPNNVAAESSPVTTLLEMIVGDDLCEMLGFSVAQGGDIRPWGHITCDGSVANLEAMWAARNLKLY